MLVLTLLTAFAQSQPAARPRTTFQPGIDIDWSQPAVIVSGTVVQQAGPLEFVACFGGKEHESLVRMRCRAAHLYMALGLIGATPGHPPRWDDAAQLVEPAAGDLVELEFVYPVRADALFDPPGGPLPEPAARVSGAGAGLPAPLVLLRESPFDWLVEAEFESPPLPRPFLFCGSQVLGDRSLAADRTGAGAALVDFPDNLLCLSRSHISRNDELWAFADPARVPPPGTPVQVIFRPARPRDFEIELDFRGDAHVRVRRDAGDAAAAPLQFVTGPDLADLLQLNQRLRPEAIQIITTDRTLASDIDAYRALFRTAGVDEARVRFVARP